MRVTRQAIFPLGLLLTGLVFLAASGPGWHEAWCLLVLPGRSAPKWEPIPPEEFQAGPSTIDPNAGAEVIYSESFADFSDLRNYEFTVHVRTRILTAAGAEAASLGRIPFDPEADFEFFQARTIQPDGTSVEVDKKSIFDRVAENFVVPKGALEFARELVSGVVARLPELDELVSLHARNWRVSRMAVVDRNVLRLGAHELRDTATPVAVVIDEAVDLARRFGSDRSPSFVNGVLDAIAKEVRSA